MTDANNDYDDNDPFAATSAPAASNTGTPSGGSDDTFTLPDVPAGVLLGYVKDVKKHDTGKYIISIQPDVPPFSQGDAVDIWIDPTNPKLLPRLLNIASTLGVPTKSQGRNVTIVGGVQALKGKTGLFVFSSYEKDGMPVPTIAWGMPKPVKDDPEGKKSSPLWDDWMAEQNLNDEQIKLLKSSPGVVPSDFFNR